MIWHMLDSLAYLGFDGMIWHMLDSLAWFGIYIGFDGISLTCWHFHVSIHISMMMIFRGV